MEKSRAEIYPGNDNASMTFSPGRDFKTPFDYILVGENSSHYRNPKKSGKNKEHHKLDLNLTGIVASNSVSL